eukprot:2463594-Prymnesium_polylepis.1
MKPTYLGCHPSFLASALELRTHAHKIIEVFGDSQCIALEQHSDLFFVPPLLMGGCEVHTIRVGMERAPHFPRNRLSAI